MTHVASVDFPDADYPLTVAIPISVNPAKSVTPPAKDALRRN